MSIYDRYTDSPAFVRRAVFHDEGREYRQSAEDGQIRLILRTAAGSVYEAAVVADGMDRPMTKARTSGVFDYYEILLPSAEYISYYFRLSTSDGVFYYTRKNSTDSVPEDGFFRILPGFCVPEWAQGAVMYQIYPDRFRNGDASNDVRTGEAAYLWGQLTHVDDWDALPEPFDVRRFYGGDLKGILDSLDYLQSLGVEVLYLNPVFVSPSNHKYDCQDYAHVDPHLGVVVHEEGGTLEPDDMDNRHAGLYRSRVTDQRNLEASDALLAELSAELHRRGMYLILDGVFNHCGSFHKWMDREGIYENVPGFAPGAFHTGDSPYRNYFRFRDENGWPENESYEGWWDHPTLPKLAYEDSRELEEEVFAVAEKWISPPYSADGWRLDVAADLGHSQEYNHSFWKEFRRRVKSVSGDAIIMAEHYGDPAPYLNGDEWDTVMNYDAFMDPVSYFLTGMEKHSDDYRGDLHADALRFIYEMTERMSAFPGPALLAAMCELDNHDHSRFLTRTNGIVGRIGTMGAEAASRDVRPEILKAAVIMQMTLPGAPTLYYGDEAGVTGFTDPDSRRTFPWGREDPDLLHFYREAIAAHRSAECLRRGSFLFLYAEGAFVAYARFLEGEAAVTAVNAGADECQVMLPVMLSGIPASGELYIRELCSSIASGMTYSTGASCPVNEGVMHLTMRPFEASVYLWKRDQEPAAP